MAQLLDIVMAHIEAAGAAPDPQRAATTLLALNDGLNAHVLGGYLTVEDALAALDAQLDGVFSTPGHHR